MRRRGRVPPPSSRNLRLLEIPGVYLRVSPAWGPVSRVQKKLDACRKKPSFLAACKHSRCPPNGETARPDGCCLSRRLIWTLGFHDSPLSISSPMACFFSGILSCWSPLSTLSLFCLQNQLKLQPVAPTGIWQRLSNRRGDCHVYAAGCPRRACAFCSAVLDSATPERLLTCLRTPSRTSQKSWLDGRARARMAGSVIWIFPMGCGDPWKVSEQVSGRFGADLVGKWTQALELLQVPLCIPLLWGKPTWVRGYGKIFSLKSWVLAAQLLRNTVCVNCGFSKSILYHNLSAAAFSTYSSPTEYFMVQILKKRDLIGLGQATLTYLGIVYLESRFYPWPRCMPGESQGQRNLVGYSS